MKGFTLLEIMIALAIMAGVFITVITSFNYHMSLAARDREETSLLLLARGKLEELEFTGDLPEKKDGSFAPSRPEVTWHLKREETQFPGISHVVVTVQDGEKSKVSIADYVQ